MTALLVSVRNRDEARLAVAGGADVIDIKEPTAGAIGAVALPEVRAILRGAERAERLYSATCGDLTFDPAERALLLKQVALLADTGIDIVKFGVFSVVDSTQLFASVAAAAKKQRLVAVVFADRIADPMPLIAAASACGIYGIMLDTAEKRAGSLCSTLALPVLAEFVSEAHRNGLVAGLAGSLRATDIAALLPLGADYLGFRGAACELGARGGILSLERVQGLAATLSQGRAADSTMSAALGQRMVEAG